MLPMPRHPFASGQHLRLMVLIDARHGIKDVDREILEMLDKAAVSYQLVLTKAAVEAIEARFSEKEAA